MLVEVTCALAEDKIFLKNKLNSLIAYCTVYTVQCTLTVIPFLYHAQTKFLTMKNVTIKLDFFGSALLVSSAWHWLITV